MIDTICLLIPKDKMTYISGVINWELHSKTDEFSRFVRNSNKIEKETGQYFPKLTEFKKRFFQDANIRMEFSLPKLLYLNNLEELEDKDFPEIIDVLQGRLKMMGIIITKEVLETAPVSSVHFSKNLLLQNGYTASYLISEMNKVNLRKSFDFAKVRYINDGESLYAHATSHQFAIYDKVADLAKNNKRAMDKDQTLYQRRLSSQLSKENKRLEIIRFEIRLSQKQKLNEVLESFGYHKNLNFQQIFSTEISKKVVAGYWNKFIKEHSLGIFSLAISSKDMLQKLLLADNKMKPKQAIYLIGLYTLAKDENGLRQLRTMVSKQSHDRTWYRIVKDMQKVDESVSRNKLRDWVTQIDKGLEDYKPYKIKNYENR